MSLSHSTNADIFTILLARYRKQEISMTITRRASFPLINPQVLLATLFASFSFQTATPIVCATRSLIAEQDPNNEIESTRTPTDSASSSSAQEDPDWVQASKDSDFADISAEVFEDLLNEQQECLMGFKNGKKISLKEREEVALLKREINMKRLERVLAAIDAEKMKEED